MDLGNKSPDLRSLMEAEEEIEDAIRLMENFPFLLLTHSSDQGWLSDSDSCDTMDPMDDVVESLAPMTPPLTPVKTEPPVPRSCDQLLVTCDLSYFEPATKVGFPSLPYYEPTAKVEFQGLKKVYEKTQSRVNKISRQRVESGKVRIMVTSEAQIQHIDVHVERVPKAATLFGDNCGQVRLETHKYVHHNSKHYYSVDLDSVYKTERGIPVYKLSTVDAERRNQFRIVVRIVFLPDTKSRPYYSPPFLLRSRRNSATARRTSSCSF